MVIRAYRLGFSTGFLRRLNARFSGLGFEAPAWVSSGLHKLSLEGFGMGSSLS